MSDMDCIEFDEYLGDYLDGELQAGVRREFAAHALQCLECRALLDDVKRKLGGADPEELVDGRAGLESALEMIPENQSPLDCSRFEDLITEFLDGFVPASTYHRFAEHSDQCSDCSRVLTHVVYAVAACHSVHTYEEVDVPETLTESLLGIQAGECDEAVAGVEQGRTRWDRFQGSRFCETWPGMKMVRRLALVRFRREPDALPRFATAAGLVAASLAMLIFGSARELALSNINQIYREAQTKAGMIYSQGVDIYSQKDEVGARFQRVGADFTQVWKAIGGPPNGATAARPDGGLAGAGPRDRNSLPKKK
ncbi:MAG TPA: anti-sigma factor [Blastocatellia bacterium]|nr:anti-sigma factor [Blastocatellia bacterium]